MSPQAQGTTYGQSTHEARLGRRSKSALWLVFPCYHRTWARRYRTCRCRRPLTPLGWKDAGNAALARQDLNVAHTSYTEGIKLITEKSEASDQSLEQDLYRNRSRVRLALGRFEDAIEDAVAALTYISDEDHKKLDAKAYFRAASASYALKSYDKAVLFLCDELELIPDDEDALILLNKVQDRLREQSRGCYDIMDIKKKLHKKPRVDVADFTINTAVKPSGPKRGRGLFATCDLEPGDLIMAEPAFCSVWSHEADDLIAFECNSRSPDEIHPGLPGLWRSTVNEVSKNPSKGSDLLRHHGDYKGTGTKVKRIGGVAVVDTFKVHDIVACNAFALPPVNVDNPFDLSVSEMAKDLSELAKGSAGIWIRLSYINHSCIPNSQMIFHGDLATIHATRPIAAGEEITLSYTGEYKDFEVRTKEMKFSWGFQCKCALCKADAECPPSVHPERSRLLMEIFTGVRAPSPSNTRNIDKLEKCMLSIDRTYDPKLYASLPKGALAMSHTLLLLHYTSCKDRTKSFQVTVKLLRSLGYEVDTQGDALCKITPTTYSVFPEEIVASQLLGPLADQGIRAHITGATAVAKHLLEFTKSVARICRGSDADAVEVFKQHLSSIAGKSLSVTAMEKEMAKLGL